MESDGSLPLSSEKFNKITQGCGLSDREGLRQARKAGLGRSWEEAVREGEGNKERRKESPGTQ